MPIISPSGGGGSPTGAAGGSLAGTYPNPTFAAGFGSQLLFSSVLGAPAASIDTGAAGIAAGFNTLMVYAVLATADAGAQGNINIIFNNDAGANYDFVNVRNSNATPAGSNTLASNQWQMAIHGAGGTASYASPLTIWIPAYTATTFLKVGQLSVGTIDGTAANTQTVWATGGYRSTTAISRMKITGATANLVTGSALYIYGM